MGTGDIMLGGNLAGGVVILSVASRYGNQVKLWQLGASGLVKTLPFHLHQCNM